MSIFILWWEAREGTEGQWRDKPEQSTIMHKMSLLVTKKINLKINILEFVEPMFPMATK